MTALALPVVPLVKYMSMMSSSLVAASPVGRTHSSEPSSSILSKEIHPSRSPATTILWRTVGLSASASSVCSQT